MKISLLRISLCVALLLALSACGAQEMARQDDLSAPAPQLPALPGPASLLRQTAASTDFLIQQPGADFAADLPSFGCMADQGLAHFTALGPNSGGSGLKGASYSVYRLSFDPLATPVTLSLDWSLAPGGQCWVGLSDWAQNRWHWIPLPAGGETELADPGRYVDPAQRCFAVVLCADQGSCSLSSIGFGDPPPPPPSSDGYTLVAPLLGRDSHLVDMQGNIVHTWSSNYSAGASAVLLENGHLLRGANIPNGNFGGGGRSGRLEEFDWEGNLVWYYQHSTSNETTHHDFKRMPNGNILLIVWYFIPDEEILSLGRNPDFLEPGTFLADKIIEIEPTLPSGGNIVWEWRVQDHLVQNFSDVLPDHDDPADHPELIDVNYPPVVAGDWTHCNAVDYNPELDQIMITSPTFSEIWVIDHSTTTEEAAGHTGGRSGRGGDVLFRWGNPLAYNTGPAEGQQINFCHNGHWIEPGLDGAGDILIFDNRPSPWEVDAAYSSIVQLTPSLNENGTYNMGSNGFAPDVPTWEYVSDPPENFSSPVMSGVQRLPGGNTLICAATSGFIFEVDKDGNTVWDYQATLNSMPSTFVFRALRYTYDYPGVANLLEP
ncbi:aryl-sulfate sulfotransferase [bacterium]|nr:aryl-sulfate sulfotransferase [bacterium]